jgi:hypothetical protein
MEHAEDNPFVTSHTPFDGKSNLLGGGWTYHTKCSSTRALSPIHFKGAQVPFMQHVGFTDNRFKLIEEGHGLEKNINFLQWVGEFLPCIVGCV